MPLDDADLAKLAEMMDAKLTDNNTELAKQFVTGDTAAKMITQGLTTGFKDIDIGGQITTALAGFKPADDKKPAGAEGEASPALLRLQEQIETQSAQIREQTEAREAAEATGRQQRLDSAIHGALAAAGLPASKIALAMPYLKDLKLKDGKPVISISDNGEMTYHQQKGGYVDPISITDGIAGWSTTDDGKSFLPASGVNGDGQGAGGTHNPNPSAIKATRDSDGKLVLGPLHKRLRDSLAAATVRS